MSICWFYISRSNNLNFGAKSIAGGLLFIGGGYVCNVMSVCMYVRMQCMYVMYACNVCMYVCNVMYVTQCMYVCMYVM